MLGDYLTNIMVISALIGVILMILKNVIPGVFSAIIIVLKLLLNLALIPVSLIVSILQLIFSRRGKVASFVKYTTTVSERYIDKKGNVRTHTDSIETTVPRKSKRSDIFNKSGRF